MNKIIIKLFFCLITVYTIFNYNLSAQTNTITGNDQCLKFSIGYGRNGVDSKIGSFPILNLFYAFHLKENIILQAGVEYYQSKNQRPYYFLEYKGTKYTGNYCQLWKNISIDLISKFKVSDLSYLGFGISIEGIDIKIDKPRENFPLRPDYMTDEMYYFNEITHDKIIRLGVIGEATLEPSYNWIIEPFLSIKYKMIFCGKKYGKTALNVQDIFSISIGLKYNF